MIWRGIAFAKNRKIFILVKMKEGVENRQLDLFIKLGNITDAELETFGNILIKWKSTYEKLPRIDKMKILFLHNLSDADLAILVEEESCLNGVALHQKSQGRFLQFLHMEFGGRYEKYIKKSEGSLKF